MNCSFVVPVDTTTRPCTEIPVTFGRINGSDRYCSHILDVTDGAQNEGCLRANSLHRCTEWWGDFFLPKRFLFILGMTKECSPLLWWGELTFVQPDKQNSGPRGRNTWARADQIGGVDFISSILFLKKYDFNLCFIRI